VSASERARRVLMAPATTAMRLKPLLAVIAVLVLLLSPQGGVPVAEAHSMYTVPLVVQHSGKCMDVEGGSTASGAKVIQWTCHGGENQQIDIIDKGSGWHQLKFRHSGKCLDVPYGDPTPGVQLQQYSCSDANRYKFTVPSGYNRTSQIKNKGNGFCADVYNQGTSDGDAVIQWPCNGQNNQKWKVPACLDQFITPKCTDISPYAPCRSQGSNPGTSFDVRFDAYGRTVYCNNVEDRVTIHWVELTMNVQSATEPLSCQGTEMNDDPEGGRSEIYRVNSNTPFPLDVGDGWRGSIVYWYDPFDGTPLTFQKSSGDEKLLTWDLATVNKYVRELWTCGTNYSMTAPNCFHQWASGWSMQTNKNWTNGHWAVALQRAPGGT